MTWYQPPINDPGMFVNGTRFDDAGPVASGTPGRRGALEAAARLTALAGVPGTVFGVDPAELKNEK
jgi:hypothetical protein